MNEDLETYYIANDAEAVDAIELLMQQRQIGFDCETTGLESWNKDHRLRTVNTAMRNPSKGNILCYVLDVWKMNDAKEALKQLLTTPFPVKVGHYLKFDIPFVRRWLKVWEFGGLFDTLVAAQILGCGTRFGNLGLDDLALEFLDEHLSKEEQTSDWSVDPLTDKQIVYAAKDAAIPLVLREKMIPLLKEKRLFNTAKLEFEVIEPLASMHHNGFYMNQHDWALVYRDLYKHCRTLAIRLHELLGQQNKLFDDAPSDINLDSPKDVIMAYQRLGIELPVVDGDESGKATTISWKMQNIQDQHESIPLLLDYRSEKTLLKSFGENWYDYIGVDGRIHAEHDQLGTRTSRFASYHPNLNNVPRDNKYRNCFQARPGWKLVWADYSQAELRIAAEFSQDKLMQEAFIKGWDFHAYTTHRIFDVTLEDALNAVKISKNGDQLTDKEDEALYLRNAIAKHMNFLVTYGGGAWKLAQACMISEDRAEGIINDYFDEFKLLYSWLQQQGQRAVSTRKTWTIVGRTLEFRFDPNDAKSRGHVERQGKNTPIQGSLADILKRALRLLFNEIGTSNKIKLVNIVHDEIVLEVEETAVKRARSILYETMKQAWEEFIKVVPIVIDVKVGGRWQK